MEELKDNWYRVLQRTETRKKVSFRDYLFLKRGTFTAVWIVTTPLSLFIAEKMQMPFWTVSITLTLVTMFVIYRRSSESFTKKELSLLATFSRILYQSTLQKGKVNYGTLKSLLKTPLRVLKLLLTND